MMLVGLVAGLLAGLAVAVLQHFVTTPLILKAETYENAPDAPAAGTAPQSLWQGAMIQLAHGGGGHAAHEGEHDWKPGDGLSRTTFTGFATVLAGIGFALVLLAGMVAAGDAITLTTALGWAAAGFLATGLMPAIGLAPELPGSAAGPLLARQIWWGGTAVATAVALWLALRVKRPWAVVAALVVAALPFVIGAPEPESFVSKVPAELAATFAARSLALQAMLWLAVGAAVAFFWPRLGAARNQAYPA